MRVAVVGSGISGLMCAHVLGRHHEVTVFEADDRAGGHAHTSRVTVAGREHAVDTGFIVYNEQTYPIFSRLIADLGVETRPTEMSFSVSDEGAGIEWASTSVQSVFAQPRNLVRPSFLRMLEEVLRFNRAARDLLSRSGNSDLTIGAFLSSGGWSEEFLEWYLVPMGAAIWSADPGEFLEFPAVALATFFESHGLLQVAGRPTWRTIVGGSATYVRAIVEPLGERMRLGAGVDKVVRRASGVELATIGGDVESFDHVVIATHSDQALRVLSDPTPAERDVLGAIRYRPNVATLHTDARMLPTRRRARASWNWRRRPDISGATLTYDLGRLQGLTSEVPICLTLNEPTAVAPDTVIETMTYLHPIFDAAAMRAQRRHGEISGRDGVSYCGAYWGYGFHEDGARSAIEVCRTLGVTWPVAP